MEQNGHNGELNDASTSGASSSKATTTNSATTSLNELTRGVDSLLTMLSEVDQDKRDLIDAADAERREGFAMCSTSRASRPMTPATLLPSCGR